MMNEILNLCVEYLNLALQMFIRPWTKMQTIWLVLPLILILILTHLYFGRYRSEEIGWNSAFGNSISLLWVCVLLFRFLFDKYGLADFFLNTEAVKSLFIILILTFFVFALLFLNFFHILPRKLAFGLSSPDSVYIMAYVIISVILGDFLLNMRIVIAAVILFIIMLTALQIIKHLIPIARASKEVIKIREEKEHRKKSIKKAVAARKFNRRIKKIKEIIKNHF